MTDKNFEPQAPGRWRSVAVCLLLALITLTVFGQTFGFQFVNLDDPVYVIENPLVAGGLGWRGVAWAFTHADCSLYHPLTMLSLMANYQLNGLHPGGYHLVNVLLHTASVICLFLVLREMTGDFWPSAFVAAVFAIHPLRVESVAWIAERKDVLGAFFFMLTIAAYARYVRRAGSWPLYLLVTAAMLMALLSKPTAVTLPFVLLLLDYWPLRRVEPPGRLILEKLPWLALALGVCVATVLAASKGIAGNAPVSMASRLANAVISYAVYLRETIWPSGLAAFYPRPPNGHPAAIVVISILVLILLTAVVLVFRRKAPWLVVGWLWYLGMLVPMIGVVQAGAFAHADRMTYLPQIGVCLALTWSVAAWRPHPLICGGLASTALALLMVCAWKQTRYWEDSELLWHRALNCTSGNYLARYNLGSYLVRAGRVDEAGADFQEALRFKPDYFEADNNLGNILLQQGRVDEAIAQFHQALKISPDYAEAHCNLGVALAQKGRADEAVAEYRRALEIQPDYPAARGDLALALLKAGKAKDALAEYASALRIHPDSADVHFSLAVLLLQGGQAQEGLSHLREAMRLRPLDPSIQDKLAWVLATSPDASSRNGGEALDLAMQVNGLTGGEEPAFLRTLAAAEAEAGRFSDAAGTARHALDLARTQGNNTLTESLASELMLYSSGKPFHTGPAAR